MPNVITINGKTYTERVIDSMVIEGQVVEGNYISEDYSKIGEVVKLEINIKSLEEGVVGQNLNVESSSNINIQSVETNSNINTQSMESADISEITTEEISKQDTLKSRIIKSIINFLSKFIS